MYELKKTSDCHYTVIFTKTVNKRNGDVENCAGDKFYTLTFEKAINLIAHRKTQDEFGDRNVSLKDYLSAFYLNWNIIYNENS